MVFPSLDAFSVVIIFSNPLSLYFVAAQNTCKILYLMKYSWLPFDLAASEQVNNIVVVDARILMFHIIHGCRNFCFFFLSLIFVLANEKHEGSLFIGFCVRSRGKHNKNSRKVILKRRKKSERVNYFPSHLKVQLNIFFLFPRSRKAINRSLHKWNTSSIDIHVPLSAVFNWMNGKPFKMFSFLVCCFVVARWNWLQLKLIGI